MTGGIEVLREVYRIIERRGGAIYRTEYVEDQWIDPDKTPPQNYLYVAKPTSFTGVDIRRVPSKEVN